MQYFLKPDWQGHALERSLLDCLCFGSLLGRLVATPDHSPPVGPGQWPGHLLLHIVEAHAGQIKIR